MKQRNGFVSNSSSSSFVIKKHYLSPQQIEQINDHVNVSCDWVHFSWDDDAWSIEEDEYVLAGSTTMDNFPMGEFLDRIGVAEDQIKWG